MHQVQDKGNKAQLEVLEKKKDLLNSIKEQSVDENIDITVDTVKTFVDEWRDLGRVPFDMRHIEVKFNKLLDKIRRNYKPFIVLKIYMEEQSTFLMSLFFIELKMLLIHCILLQSLKFRM